MSSEISKYELESMTVSDLANLCGEITTMNLHPKKEYFEKCNFLFSVVQHFCRKCKNNLDVMEEFVTIFRELITCFVSTFTNYVDHPMGDEYIQHALEILHLWRRCNVKLPKEMRFDTMTSNEQYFITMIEHMALISDFGFQIQIFWVFFDYVDFNSADEKGYLVKLLQREEFPERFLQSLYTQFLPIKEFQLTVFRMISERNAVKGTGSYAFEAEMIKLNNELIGSLIPEATNFVAFSPTRQCISFQLRSSHFGDRAPYMIAYALNTSINSNAKLQNDKLTIKIDVELPIIVMCGTKKYNANLDKKTRRVQQIEIVFANVLKNFQRLMTAIQLFVEWGKLNFEIDGFSEIYEVQILHLYATNKAIHLNNIIADELDLSTASSDENACNRTGDDQSKYLPVQQSGYVDSDKNAESKIPAGHTIANISQIIDGFEKVAWNSDNNGTDIDAITISSDSSTSNSSNSLNLEEVSNLVPHSTPLFVQLYNHPVDITNRSFEMSNVLGTPPLVKEYLRLTPFTIDMTLNNVLYEPKSQPRTPVRAANNQSEEIVMADTSEMEWKRHNLRKQKVIHVKIESKQGDDLNNNLSAKSERSATPLNPHVSWSYRQIKE